MRDTRSLSRWFSGCIAGAALALLFAAPHTLFADTAPPPRVARLTFVDGTVTVSRPESTASDAGQLNMPLIEAQGIVTGENGQAEIEFEDGSVARLTPNSNLRLAHLTVDSNGSYTTRLSLLKGLAFFELRAAPKFAYTVDAGGDLISPAENTTVRVTLDEPPAAVAVLVGTAHVERLESYRIDVRSGETFRSDISSPGRYFLTQEIAPDSWDQWNEARDQAALDAAPAQTTARDGYAGSQGYGWSDLDANGSWYNVPGQGEVWQPQGGDQDSFDPYDNGSWVWYQGGGYQWASSYSWGWTPYRCGGWSYWTGFGWGWAPNAACYGYGFAGYGGWGYGGGGYGGGGYGGGGFINILQPRKNYPDHRPPTGGPRDGVHPIIRIHDGGRPGEHGPGRGPDRGPGPVRPGAPQPGQLQPGLRRIAGVVAVPLKPVGVAYTPRGGSAVGSTLARDFPVDRTTHRPVMGVPSGTNPPGSVNAGVGGQRNGGFQGGGQRNGGDRTDRTTIGQPGLQPGTRSGFVGNPNPQPGSTQPGSVQSGYQRGTAPNQPGVPQNGQNGQNGMRPGFDSGMRRPQPGSQPNSQPSGQPGSQPNSQPSGQPGVQQGLRPEPGMRPGPAPAQGGYVRPPAPSMPQQPMQRPNVQQSAPQQMAPRYNPPPQQQQQQRFSPPPAPAPRSTPGPSPK